MDSNEEVKLPQRLFAIGEEPSCRHRINNYITLRWIEDIKPALNNTSKQRLYDSQFGYLMQMGNHTFSVNFVHHLLCRQLVTNKENELWWLFEGKPIRYNLKEFTLVTGLNCEKGVTTTTSCSRSKKGKGKGKYNGFGPESALWNQLFGKERKPIVNTIYEMLMQGDTCKDEMTRFRLSLLLFVYGICCPTSPATLIKEEFVEMVDDVDLFLQYPWGRKSFLLTVGSRKAKEPINYTQETMTIQGFAHAMELVSVCSCPQIYRYLVLKRCVSNEDGTVEDIAACLAELSLNVNVDRTRRFDRNGHINVTSCVADTVMRFGSEYEFADDEPDECLDYLISQIQSGHQFEQNSWKGGYRAVDLVK